jgi:hypothetical protein
MEKCDNRKEMLGRQLTVKIDSGQELRRRGRGSALQVVMRVVPRTRRRSFGPESGTRASFPPISTLYQHSLLVLYFRGREQSTVLTVRASVKFGVTVLRTHNNRMGQGAS